MSIHSTVHWPLKKENVTTNCHAMPCHATFVFVYTAAFFTEFFLFSSGGVVVTVTVAKLVFWLG